MRVVRTEDAKQVGAERKRVRVGSLQNVWLGRGTPGTANNYFFTSATTQSDYHTPRHRHNFEQIRVQLRGEFDYERDGKMVPLGADADGLDGLRPNGVIRDEIHIPTVPAAFMMDAQTGYVRISEFGENTGAELNQALRGLQRRQLLKVHDVDCIRCRSQF